MRLNDERAEIAQKKISLGLKSFVLNFRRNLYIYRSEYLIKHLIETNFHKLNSLSPD